MSYLKSSLDNLLAADPEPIDVVGYLHGLFCAAVEMNRPLDVAVIRDIHNAIDKWSLERHGKLIRPERVHEAQSSNDH